ncbi:uncharacterized protein LOC106167017 [Lingula anatina]|uniref:Uncharacterized protein LOC106167017 n=1 Tax=Lingula anatina TaxID=7574 RepID=A0A1S3ISU3_LINAN|nr:uncharacterized protein LOC106167017 [Lingula anatina]|eukprot:XP_013401143.1 uncharacterized protein LOC106167017 [Lingula anatina]
MLSEKIPALFIVLCMMTLHGKEVIGATYYMDDSDNDCGAATQTVYSYSHTVKAWEDSLNKPSLPSRTCTLYFDTLSSSTRVKVTFLTGSYFNCGTTLTFYDGSSTTYSNKLRTMTCGDYSTSAIYSTSRYLTVKLTTTSTSTNYDFTFYVSEVSSGSSTVAYVNVGGIIGGLVSTIITVIFFICICRCICKRRERQTTVVYRERERSSTPSVNVTVNSSNSMSNINAPQIAPQMINQGIGYMAQPQPAYLPQPPVAYPPPPQPGGYPQQPPHNPQMARAAPDAPPPYPGGHPAQYPKY